MKKTEYADVRISESGDRQLELDAGKMDESGLPQFAKEVPVSSKRTERGESVCVENRWKGSACGNIRTKEITFRAGEQLADIYMVNARDGVDTVSAKHGNAVYILRKTSKEIAKALFNAYSHVQAGLENVVGWLRTVLGSFYIISRVEHSTWSFDRRLARHDNLNYVDSDGLGDGQKRSLCDMIVQGIAALHSKRLVLGGFNINSVLLTNEGIQFTDLRGLRAARKLSFCVEEFKAIMEYLFAIGMVKPEDRYLAIATYHAMNEQGCSEWYRERTGKCAKEPLEITERMEDEIFN